MKRSEVNSAIRWAIETLDANGIRLPSLASWSPEEVQSRRSELDAVRRLSLGWDVTDFGSGDFEKVGAVLYTVRNGLVDDLTVGVPYCEKYILMKDGQVMPSHCHAFKTEDIINRVGGELAVRLWNVDPNTYRPLDSAVSVAMDGFKRTFCPGEEIHVRPGDSMTLTPYVAHSLFPRPGTGDLILGEVSRVNDDNTDNFFLDPVSRYSKIVEDEPPIRVLCNEYPPA